MQTLVIDSSVMIKWFNQVNEKLVEQARSILHDLQANKVTLLAPELAKYEICNALLIKKQLQPSEMKEVLEIFYRLPIKFIPDTQELSESAYTIALKQKITYYDAVFLAIAKHNNATLITENIKHQGKVKSIQVKSLSEYKV